MQFSRTIEVRAKLVYGRLISSKHIWKFAPGCDVPERTTVDWQEGGIGSPLMVTYDHGRGGRVVAVVIGLHVEEAVDLVFVYPELRLVQIRLTAADEQTQVTITDPHEGSNWEAFLDQLQLDANGQTLEDDPPSEEAVFAELEEDYQSAQSRLIELRQAVAMAFAEQKQTEQLMQKNRDQAATWQNRAAMSVQQNNQELANVALARKAAYDSAAADLQSFLERQEAVTMDLRKKLTELENRVQTAFTQRQILKARFRVTRAALLFEQKFEGLENDPLFEQLKRTEAEVAKLEALLPVMQPSAEPSDHEQSMLEKYVSVLERVARLLEKLEKPES